MATFVNNDLALNTGQWIGSGLRQAMAINEAIISDIENGGAGATISFESESGEIVDQLFLGSGLGEKLNLRMVDAKIGGLINAELTMKKKNGVPLFNGMVTKIFIKTEKWFTGFVDGIPETDDNSEIIKLNISGYIKKIKDYKIDKTYNNKTIKEIIDDIGPDIALSGVNYNPLKIGNLILNITDIQFNDKSIYDIMVRLRKIANVNYQTSRFNFGVDGDKDFYFQGVDFDSPVNGYYEGWQYQEPEVDKSTKNIVNRVLVYRTKLASNQEAEFVDAYDNTPSQEDFGIFEKKITVPDYTDTTTIENMANGILNEFAIPKKKVKVKKLIPEEKLQNGFYKISNRPQFQKFTIDECSDVSTWDLVDVGTVSLTTTSDNAFTGQRCFAFNFNTAIGTTLTREFDKRFDLEKVIIYMRSEVAIQDIFKVTVSGLTTDRGNWVANGENVIANYTPDNKDNLIFKTDKKVTQEYTVSFPIDNEWQRFEFDVSNYYYLDSFQIEVLKDDAINVKIDRLDIYTNSYFDNYLEFEKASYILNDKSLLADVEFGDTQTDLVDEILKIDEKNSVAVDIFAKQ